MEVTDVMDEDEELHQRFLVQFVSESGEKSGNQLDVPTECDPETLRSLCNTILASDDSITYQFFVKDVQIESTLLKTVQELQKQGIILWDSTSPDKISEEGVVEILYKPQAQFRVRAVTRCTSSMPGHSEPVLCANFSPSGQYLASGSGDCTVRFWDVDTETPMFTCAGHKNWVLVISWSPVGTKLASACKTGKIYIWDPKTGKQLGKPLVGHKEWITALAWEPLHLNGECRQLASSSKDKDIRIWDVVLGQTVRILSGHTFSVTCLRWSGAGLIYSGSQDREIKVWRPSDGVLCKTLTGHAHWVNSIALNTDYVTRTGAFEPAEASLVYGEEELDAATLKAKAQARYDLICNEKPGMEEYMVSGSDDFTMLLWCPVKSPKPVVQMTGHQQLVNDVKFSPDGRIIASASFDKSIKLWDGKTGKFIGTLRGHVQAVYQIAWSADSRLLVSASADSTINLWSMRTKALELNLPGHADQVYTIDWAPNGLRVVSGGKDRILKIWRQ